MEDYQATLIGIIVGALISIIVAIIMSVQNRKTMTEQAYLKMNLDALMIMTKALADNLVLWQMLENACLDLESTEDVTEIQKKKKSVRENTDIWTVQNKILHKELSGYTCFLTVEQMAVNIKSMETNGGNVKKFKELFDKDYPIEEIKNLVKSSKEYSVNTVTGFTIMSNKDLLKVAKQGIKKV